MKQITWQVFLLFVLCAPFLSGEISAQTEQSGNFAAERNRAIELINQNKFLEALPIFEKLSAHKSADGQIFYGLGLAVLRKADETTDIGVSKALRVKARTAFLKAKDLGVRDINIDMMLRTIKLDGGLQGRSDNPKAQAAMDAGLESFNNGDYQKAVELYSKAAQLDPMLYEAMLFTGNSYYAAKEYDKAGVWFAKAIAINPNRETAYRYWADAYMKSGKQAEAQDKFLDAIIAEPYSQFTWHGLMQFAKRNNIKLGQPPIEIPANVSTGENGNLNITLGTKEKDDDDAFAWTFYGLSRASWQVGEDGKLSEQFSKAYPNEKTYRHSLAEEVSALRGTLGAIKQNKKIKNLNSSLLALQKLSDENLLEPFILLTRADSGIQQDYEAYRSGNRDKLKRYLVEYVLQSGKN